MKYPTLRQLIKEMIVERYNRDQQETLAHLSEEKVPNSEDTTAIKNIGDPVDEVELNSIVKNVPMGKKGSKMPARTNKSTKKN